MTGRNLYPLVCLLCAQHTHTLQSSLWHVTISRLKALFAQEAATFIATKVASTAYRWFLYTLPGNSPAQWLLTLPFVPKHVIEF